MDTTPLGQKKQAHGLTHEQMEEVRYQQASAPEEIETIPGNNTGDAVTDKLFKDEYADYKLPKVEENHYHIVAESPQYNQATGEKLSTAILHKFTPEAYEFQKEHSGFSGQRTHILHNPKLNGNDLNAKQEKDLGGKKDLVEYKTEEELQDMTNSELLDYYEELTGVRLPSNLRKADIISKTLEQSPQ